MKFKVPPLQHQLDVIKLSDTHKDLALLWEMGTGKTAGVINILRKHYTKHGISRTLVLAPLVVLQNWRDEILKFSNIQSQDIVVLNGSGAKRTQDFVNKACGRNCLVVTNYDFLLNANIQKLLFEWAPKILVCDESHLLKSYNSKRAKFVARLGDQAEHRYLLTGTPIINSPLDIYMQWRILDGGKTFGSNFFSFRATYFEDKNALWSHSANHFPKWEVREDRLALLHAKMYQKAHRVLKKDCLDLPPYIVINRPVELSKEQKQLYKEMKDNFIAWCEIEKNGVTKQVASVAEIALTKLIRLQQITTGLFRPEEGADVTLEYIPRLQALQELLAGLTWEHKVIVWCSFKHEYTQLSKVCDEIGVRYVLLTGEQNAKAKEESVQSFRNDPKTRVIIANRRAGGIGINLVEGAYSIVYSRNFSLGEELQSEARNYRRGSEVHNTITRINLYAEGTIDELIMKALASKQDISSKIVDIIKDLKE